MMRRNLFFACGLALGSTLGPACSVVLDFPQCQETSDCANSAGRLLVCIDQQCVDRPPPSAIACESDADCVETFDRAHVCGPSGLCASVVAEGCSIAVEPAADADPASIVFVGSILPASDPFSLGLTPDPAAIAMAFEDFVQSGALGSETAVGLVQCDSQGSETEATAMARHLVQEVGVPLLIGPGLTDGLEAIANEITVPEGAVLLAPSSGAVALTELDDRGLVFQALSDDAVHAAAIADRIVTLDPPADRILFLGRNDAVGADLTARTTDAVAERLPDSKRASLLYPPPGAFGTSDDRVTSYRGLADQSMPHRADVVVLAGGAETLELVLLYLTARDAQEERPPLPRFIVSTGGLATLPEIVEGVSGQFQPTLAAQLQAITAIVSDPSQLDAFGERLGERIEAPSQGLSMVSARGYDATMAGLLAIAVVGPSGSGSDVAAALASMSGTGTAVRIDSPDELAAAVEALRSGTVNLSGYAGPLAFGTSGSSEAGPLAWGISVDGVIRLVALDRYASGTWEPL